MSWSGLGTNDWVPNNDAQDAVNNGLVYLNSGQTIPANNTWMTISEANTKLVIDFISGNGSNWVNKGLINPILDIPCGTEFEVNSNVNYYERIVTVGTTSGSIDIDLDIYWNNSYNTIGVYITNGSTTTTVYGNLGTTSSGHITTTVNYNFVYGSSSTIKIKVIKTIGQVQITFQSAIAASVPSYVTMDNVIGSNNVYVHSENYPPAGVWGNVGTVVNDGVVKSVNMTLYNSDSQAFGIAGFWHTTLREYNNYQITFYLNGVVIGVYQRQLFKESDATTTNYGYEHNFVTALGHEYQFVEGDVVKIYLEKL